MEGSEEFLYSACSTSEEKDLHSKSNDILRYFIKVYEKHPELWDSSHPLYSNKLKRIQALDLLVHIYRKLKPGANRNDVRKKINTLRSNFRKEEKKIALSKTSGAANVYKPASWVFHCLNFLKNSDQPDNGSKTRNEYLNEVHAFEYEDGSIDIVDDVFEETIHVEHAPAQHPSTTSTPIQTSFTVPPPPNRRSPTTSGLYHRPPKQPRKKRKLGSVDKERQNELLSLAYEFLNKSKERVENEPTIIKVWGEKLITLDREQRLFAEKAINDVLFEASLGNLHRYSVRINEDPQHVSRIITESVLDVTPQEFRDND